MIDKIISSIITLLELIQLLIFVDAISTWFLPPRSNRFLKFIGFLIDPFLVPARKLQSLVIKNLPIDFSPIIAFLFIEVIKALINILL